MENKEKNELKFYNIDCELAILGTLILNDNYFDVVNEEIKAEYFYENVNKEIYNILVNEIKTNKKINSTTIKNTLQPVFDKYGLGNYLAVLLNTGCGIVDIKPYCQELKNLYAKRELQKIMFACQDSLNQPYNADEIMQNVKNKLDVLEEEASNYEYEVKSFAEIMAQRVVEIETTIKDKEQTNYIKTDIIDFDREFTGIPRAQLTILGGRSSMGKSTLALQIALNVAKQGKNVLFFSQEMGLRENADKIIANLNKINSVKVRDSHLSNEELEKIKKNCELSSDYRLFIVEKQGIDNNYITKTIKRFQRKIGKVDLIIVDHLQMTRDSQKSRNRIEELGNITLDFKEIAKKYNCGFILLSQLSRGVEGRESPRPELIDLRESGRIEENADLIMFIYRKDYYINRQLQGIEDDNPKREKLLADYERYKNQADIMVKKYRNGKCGSITIKFEPEYSLFRELRGDECNI